MLREIIFIRLQTSKRTQIYRRTISFYEISENSFNIQCPSINWKSLYIQNTDPDKT